MAPDLSTLTLRRILISLMISIAACSGEPEPEPAGIGDGLSDEQAARADATPSVKIETRSIILPNGKRLEDYARERGIVTSPLTRTSQGAEAILPLAEVTGPQQRKNDIIMMMILGGYRLINDGNWIFSSAGPNQPAQTGLAYVYGSRDPEQRASGGTCRELLHGLDCSGMVYQAAIYANLALSPSKTAAEQATPKTWNDIFPKHWGLEMQEVTAGSVPESGDIAYWPGHVGIVVSGGSGTDVFQSNGSSSYSCEANKAPNRGPRAVALSEINKWFGNKTPKLLRIVATMAGQWDFHLRCSGRISDAARVRLSIEPKGGAFEATGTGTDYDGDLLSISISGIYDQAKNTLSGKINPAPGRIDGFSVRLLEDDTGYFSLEKIQDNGGCFAEGRLVRVDVRTP